MRESTSTPRPDNTSIRSTGSSLTRRRSASGSPTGSRDSSAAGGSSSIQSVIVLIWIVGNVYLLFHFDPYPFILLNLAFSTQAAYAAPLILLAGNRAAIRDRMTLEHASEEADIEEIQNEQLLRGNREILEHVDRLEHQIIDLEKRILEAPRKPPDVTTGCNLGPGRR